MMMVMIRKLKELLIGLTLATGFTLAAVPAASAIDLFGDCSGNSGTKVCNAGGKDSAKDIIANIIGAILWIVGALAVLMIIISGLKYVTSNGDSNKIQSAKNTLLYSIVGLVVAIFGQAIVFFVVNQLT